MPTPQSSAREGITDSLTGDGAEIHFRVHGQGQPAILLIHGWSCDSRYWNAQIDHLAAQHAVVTVDLAGHGESSSGNREHWTIEAFGDDVAAVVEALALDKVVLVGHSMGGPVAVLAARRLPGRVIGIVGVDTFRDSGSGRPVADVERIIAPFRADFATSTRGFVAGNFFTAASDEELKRWIVDDMSSAPAQIAVPAMQSLLSLDHAAAFAAVDLPVVAINAAAPPTDLAAMRAVEPKFELLLMQDTGHFPMMERPAEFNELLDGVLRSWQAPELPATTTR